MLAPLRTPRLFFTNLGTLMFLSGTLGAHLREIRCTAAQRCTMLTNQMAQTVGITKGLKATDQMSYVQQMNAIDAQVREIISEELICA